MLYLASQFSWFLLAAFGLACAMGWVGQSSPERHWWSPAWTVLALVWGLGAVLVWFQFVNGVAAVWIETALLFAAVYWCGCAVGGALAALAIARRPRPLVAEPAPLRIEPLLSEPLAAAVPDVPRHPGVRPAALDAPRDGKADDLKQIKGIGRQSATRLNALGIWHVDQIATWTPENVTWLASELGAAGRIERENWVEQAKRLTEAGPGTSDQTRSSADGDRPAEAEATEPAADLCDPDVAKSQSQP